jgi:hypothetical protein
VATGFGSGWSEGKTVGTVHIQMLLNTIACHHFSTDRAGVGDL